MDVSKPGLALCRRMGSEFGSLLSIYDCAGKFDPGLRREKRDVGIETGSPRFASKGPHFGRQAVEGHVICEVAESLRIMAGY